MSSEQLLGRLADEAAVRALLDRFGQMLDEKDWQGYAATFAEDGSFEIFGERRVGRAEIARGPERDLSRFERTQHFTSNHVVVIDGDEARTRSNLLAVHIPSLAEPDRHADVGARYHGLAKRTPEGWRLAEMRIEPLWSAGIPLEFEAAR